MLRRALIAGLPVLITGCVVIEHQTVLPDSNAGTVAAGAPEPAATPLHQGATSLAPAYDDEAKDFGVPPINTIRVGDYEAPTPTHVAGATTITTRQLRDMMLSSRPPLLIDVLDGNQTVSLPGAIWLRGAGLGSGLDDQVQAKLGARLAALTDGDKEKPVVFFCLSKTCWLSHNATVRALALGYSKVYWYRGGRNAWRAAGLELDPVSNSVF